MPIQELCHFTVRRFFGTGKTPSGGFTRADGRVRDRVQPGARARIHERVHADALAWFSNLDAISNPPNGVVSAVTGALFTHSCRFSSPPKLLLLPMPGKMKKKCVEFKVKTPRISLLVWTLGYRASATRYGCSRARVRAWVCVSVS